MVLKQQAGALSTWTKNRITIVIWKNIKNGFGLEKSVQNVSKHCAPFFLKKT